MKKLFLLFIAIAFIFMGCVTTTDNQVSENETSAYRPQYNMFEENDWISISDVQFFRDETSLYLYISYDSESAGECFIFNPPSGNAFKLSSNLVEGSGSILQGIEKDSLKGVEGITVFLNHVTSNDSTRVGLFINSEEIRYNQIPEKPETLTGTIIETIEPVQEQNNSIPIVVEDQTTNIEPSVWSFYEISPNDEYNTELKISIEGLDVEDVTLNFDQSWTNEKNQSRVRNISPAVQTPDAIYRFNITPTETEGRIGMNLFSDRNNNSQFDETAESEEISSFILDVTTGKGNEYVIRYITANIALQVQGDLSRYTHPMFITNRFGRGSFPRKAFPISDSIEIMTMVPTYYSRFQPVASTCELFADLNGDGIYDYDNEPIISNSITIDLEHPESPEYILTVEN